MKPLTAGLDHGFAGVDVYSIEGVGMALYVPIAYWGLCWMYRQLGWWEGRKTKFGTPVGNMVAYEVAFGLSCAYFAVHGIILYFGLNGINDMYQEPLLSDQYYGKSEYVINKLLYPMMIYQIWNLIFSLFVIPDLNKMENHAHHLVTICVQYFGFNGFLNSYAYFFIGFTEISNVFLAIVDIPRFVPEFSENWPLFYQINKLLFASSFIILRNILWPIISYPCVIDLFQLIKNGNAHSEVVVGLFLFATAVLTYLQFNWGYRLVLLMYKQLSGSGGGSSKKEDKKK